GGRHGRRADRAMQGQMSLFEAVDAPPVLPETSPANRAALDVAFEAQRRALAQPAAVGTPARAGESERPPILGTDTSPAECGGASQEGAPHGDAVCEPLLSVA
ncbi:hypothetical protein, partial [Adlercreutzia caecimuris]|uniref:hypothetical protein n=1 Tax=Adlercreutzia caecimuris TaxID=671266 RepID=UPI0025B14EF0